MAAEAFPGSLQQQAEDVGVAGLVIPAHRERGIPLQPLHLRAMRVGWVDLPPLPLVRVVVAGEPPLVERRGTRGGLAGRVHFIQLHQHIMRVAVVVH